MSRFVTPTEVRLPISGGDYLIVKERLNDGETTRHVRPDATPRAPRSIRSSSAGRGPGVPGRLVLDR